MHSIDTQVEQRSPEWFRQRLGKATGSRMGDLLAKTKKGPGEARAHYAMELVVERLTGASPIRFVNAAMEHGTMVEPLAREAYIQAMNVDLVEVGFIDHPTIAMSGASPDGLVGLDGYAEIKCLTTANHLRTLLGDPIDPDYIVQIQWGLACTKRNWCDYISFDPRLPIELQLYVQRVERDDAAIAAIEDEVRQFLAEVDDKLAALATLAGLESSHNWMSPDILLFSAA